MSNSKQVLSLRRTRLASTAGPVIIVEAGIPTSIPKVLYSLAAANGCVDYNPQMIEAFKAAVARAESSEAPAAADVDVAELIRNAVTQVALAAEDEPQLVTSQGMPRVPAVRSAYESLCAGAGIPADAKITQELVASIYAEITAPTDPTPTEQPRYPTGIPLDADLEGEEVGGVDDDLLSRVTASDEE